jgi:hypothetical protein
MVEIFNNVLSPTEIQTLLDYYYKDDELVDDRLDVRSKTPTWADTEWPGHLVKKVLDQVLPDPYYVEVVLFYGSRISFRLHTDSDQGIESGIYKNILIPLYVEGNASTVVFDNYWNGPSTRFSRTDISPFRYSLPNRQGKFIEVPDIRELLVQCKNNVSTQFDATDEFINTLEHIIAVRSGTLNKPPDNRTNDYSKIINYNPELKFSAIDHAKYVNHIPIENLHGLTIDQVVPWQVGQAITFDRNQIHCAGSGHTFKIGISIFTHKRY